MEKIFRKPGWLKPEINEFIYYPHIIILMLVAGAIMKFIFNYDSIPLVITFSLMIKLLVSLTMGDLFAHTILKLN